MSIGNSILVHPSFRETVSIPIWISRPEKTGAIVGFFLSLSLSPAPNLAKNHTRREGKGGYSVVIESELARVTKKWSDMTSTHTSININWRICCVIIKYFVSWSIPLVSLTSSQLCWSFYNHHKIVYLNFPKLINLCVLLSTHHFGHFSAVQFMAYSLMICFSLLFQFNSHSVPCKTTQ